MGLLLVNEARRSLLKLIGAGVVGLAVGVAGGYSIAPARVAEVVRTITQTQAAAVSTVTVTSPVAQTVTKTVTPVSKLPKDVIRIGVMGIRSGT
ncbi:MAG: hypothetical protein RQ885_02375 [Desulfurococcales archaeon]|jgi:hypothetical protein|nr:hypothetical protein [Desulfurococcales archaeon]